MIQYDESTIKLKSLKRLEGLFKKAKNFVLEDDKETRKRVVRTFDGTLETRTHNIVYINDTERTGEKPHIRYEGSASKWFVYEFETSEQLDEWWKNNITNDIVDTKLYPLFSQTV